MQKKKFEPFLSNKFLTLHIEIKEGEEAWAKQWKKQEAVKEGTEFWQCNEANTVQFEYRQNYKAPFAMASCKKRRFFFFT